MGVRVGSCCSAWGRRNTAGAGGSSCCMFVLNSQIRNPKVGGKGRCAMTAASKGHGLHVSERVSVLQAEVPYASAFHAALPCS